MHCAVGGDAITTGDSTEILLSRQLETKLPFWLEFLVPGAFWGLAALLGLGVVARLLQAM